MGQASWLVAGIVPGIERQPPKKRRLGNGSTKPYSPLSCWTLKKSRSQELSERFTEQRQRSRDCLVPFMQNNQPKFLTKDELRGAAMRELDVSKSAFDFG